MPNLSLNERRQQVSRYDLRGVQPHLRFGTASDRYAGWIGQVYPDHFANHTRSRKRKLGGRVFQERQVPVASVSDYFEHFSVLELDFTFYRPLLDEDGEPGKSSFHPLQKYADEAPPDALFLLKAPQAYFARKQYRNGEYVQNATFLDAEGYRHRFHEPARDLLGDRLAGVIFQQEYQRVADSPDPDANIEALDGFFSEIPRDTPMHLELRSEHLLTPAYFDWLGKRGLGFVFSHWTWLPAIREQWTRTGERFTSGDDEVVTRLLTPRDMKYAEAYAKAYPFDAPTPELAETDQARDMVLDVTALAYQAAAQNATLNVVCNNRAWGNAPDLARAVAHRILDEEERRNE